MPVLYYRDPADDQWKPLNDPGPEGPVGPTGAQGPQGAQGPTGATGAVGAAGFSGPTGPTGATGGKGTSGIQGPTGAQGAVGTTGGQGSQGPTGFTGTTGGQGPQGVSGQPRGWVVRFGYVVVNPVANRVISTPVSFSSGYGSGSFSPVPVVLVAANSSVPGTVRRTGQSAVTTVGFELEIVRTNSTATGMHWIALGV